MRREMGLLKKPQTIQDAVAQVIEAHPDWFTEDALKPYATSGISLVAYTIAKQIRSKDNDAE